MSGFEIKPVKHYTRPRYPSLYAEPDATERQPPSLTMIVLSLAMMMLIGLSLSGCWGDLKGRFEGQGWVQHSGGDGGPDGGPDDDGGDIVMGEMVECNPGDIVCADDNSLQTCTDAYYYEQQSCDEICASSSPDGFGYSLGCDVNAADPCQCEYDLIAGGMAFCDPDELRCEDENTLLTCDEYGSPEWTDCEAECDARFGDEAAYSLGCDAGAADPCQCQYDILDGDVASCTPGDIVCVDTQNVRICDDNSILIRQDCDAYCQQNYGTDFESIGCDDLDPDNFCGCKPANQ